MTDLGYAFHHLHNAQLFIHLMRCIYDRNVLTGVNLFVDFEHDLEWVVLCLEGDRFNEDAITDVAGLLAGRRIELGKDWVQELTRRSEVRYLGDVPPLEG